MHFKHTATHQPQIIVATTPSIDTLITTWGTHADGVSKTDLFQDPIRLGMILGTGKSYILGVTLSTLHNQDLQTMSKKLEHIFEMLTIWTSLITHVGMNHAPQNVKEAAQEVRKHLETLAPGLIKEDRNHRLWTIKCRLFSEIVPIVSTSKMPFKDICIFFEKALTQTTPEIKSMMELPAGIMVKEMVLRMQEGPLPNDLFCKIAHFLDARQRHSKSEPAIFHGFLDHAKWPHPDTFKFHPDITKTLTTLTQVRQKTAILRLRSKFSITTSSVRFASF